MYYANNTEQTSLVYIRPARYRELVDMAHT